MQIGDEIMEIVWKYKIDLENNSVFEEIEKKYGILVPEELREFVRQNNAATPSKYNFMLGNTEKVFGAVLSFNINDKDVDTVFTGMNSINEKNVLPFAIDPFGNYICYDVEKSEVVYWDHEFGKITSLEKNLKNFLESLY